MKIHVHVMLAVLIFLAGCTSVQEQNYAKLPTYAETGYINAIVEIPAGTNHKFEYNYESNSFPCNKEEGVDRVVAYLPYPGNYGFIPSTMMDKGRGGDGDALDILIIGESVPTGSVVQVKPIGVMKLLDRGEQDDKILAVSQEFGKRLNITDIDQLDSSMQLIIKTWFTNYKGEGKMIFQSWGDSTEAFSAIEKWKE